MILSQVLTIFENNRRKDQENPCDGLVIITTLTLFALLKQLIPDGCQFIGIVERSHVFHALA